MAMCRLSRRWSIGNRIVFPFCAFGMSHSVPPHANWLASLRENKVLAFEMRDRKWFAFDARNWKSIKLQLAMLNFRVIFESTAVSSCTQFSYLWLCGNWVQSRKLDTKYLKRFVVVFILHVESELKRPSPGQCPFTKCFIFINKSEASSALGGLVRQIVFLKISKLLVKVDKLMGKHRR